MATFGAIASAAPNVLFDAAKVDRDVQGFARNQLLMQNSVQDQQQQTYQRDTQARIAMARELVNLPEAQAAAEWGAARQRLQAGGFGQGLPEQFPGMERVKAVASSDLTTFERLKIEEQRRASEGLQSLFGIAAPAAAGGAGFPGGGGASAMPVSMPGAGAASPYAGLPPPAAGGGAAAPSGTFQGGNSGTAVRSDNATADALRQRIYDDPSMSPEQKDAALRDISLGRASALTGQPTGTTYRANPGVGGAYAGVPAPAAAPGGGQAAGQPAGGGNGNPIFAGLTPEQIRRFQAAAALPGANGPQLLAQIDATRQSNLSLQRQQQQDERQRRLDADRDAREDRRDQRAEARDARTAPSGPIRGDGLNNSLMNILITGDPASPEYAAAFARIGAEEVNPATGAVRRPDMSPYRAPTYLPPGATATAAASSAGVGAGAGAAPLGGGNAPPTLPPNALAPQAVGGRNYGRADYQASTQASPQAREAVRKAEVEVSRITGAIDRFEQVFAAQGGGSIAAVLNNPASPEAQRLLGAYEAMKATLRSEAFLNTGVLQPAEAKMLDDMLLSPQSIRGLMATPDAMKARLAEFRQMISRGLGQQRASAGLPPEVSVPGPGGQGTASPPQPGAPRRLTFNPATGKIE